MHCGEALDAQADIARFWMSENGRRYAGAFTESVAASPGGRWILDFNLRNVEADNLSSADTYCVDPDFVDLIGVASKSFIDEPLLETDLISKSGFAYLGKPISVLDVREKEMKFRAFSWLTIATGDRHVGILLCFYSHTDDEDDYPVHVPGCETRWLLSHVGELRFGVELTDMPSNVPEHRSKDNLEFYRKIQCFFRLTTQTIASRTPSVAPRSSRRRAADVVRSVATVTVVSLRRRDNEAGEGGSSEGVAWSCRWVVRGHWRKQWYPSIETHRHIWIDPFVKGPEEMALRVGKRVFDVKR